MGVFSDPVAMAMTAEGVVQMCDMHIDRARNLAEGIRVLERAADDQLTWEATFGAFDALVFEIQEAIQIPVLMGMVHPDAAVRAAAMTCEPKVDAFQSELYLDDAIAHVLRRFAARTLALTDIQTKFVEDVLREYRRNGLELPPEQRARLRELNEKMTVLGQTFERVLAETTLALELRPEQLRGLPSSYIAQHPVSERGTVRVTTDYPDLIPFLRYAEDRAAARELYILSENRGADHTLPALKDLLVLRKEKANLLGYATWADYVLEPRMAQNVASVEAFLGRLHEGLVARRQAEAAELEAVRRRMHPEETDAMIVSDARYYEDILRRERFALDTQKLSEYFEGRRVLQGILDIAHRLYGITFVPADVPVWHPDVQAFDVVQGDALIGRAYLDLHPREGKFKHAAMFGMRETRRLPDGSREIPIAALVCNFPGPVAPALMGHDDVVTFFHEFGHLLHHLLSTAELASCSGTNVARDFVEAPSQMFEAWAWDKETLRLFAFHHVTGEPLPDDMIAAMEAARRFGEAIATERQLFLAYFDLACHTQEPGSDPVQLARDMHATFSSFACPPERLFPATFGHLVGYSAGYYSYQWALSIAADLLTRFTTEGMLNTQTAREYRTNILEPGSTVPELQLVERFLGRPSTPDAYLRRLGIQG